MHFLDCYQIVHSKPIIVLFIIKRFLLDIWLLSLIHVTTLLIIFLWFFRCTASKNTKETSATTSSIIILILLYISLIWICCSLSIHLLIIKHLIIVIIELVLVSNLSSCSVANLTASIIIPSNLFFDSSLFLNLSLLSLHFFHFLGLQSSCQFFVIQTCQVFIHSTTTYCSILLSIIECWSLLSLL